MTSYFLAANSFFLIAIVIFLYFLINRNKDKI